ncbi:MAG: hypothetical protein EZS28_040125 [Streblomastix strix]|uniref:Uncharacterized protein n=1 Tax=Streblomastix strix TaxID=222440 RepID=A0A5J4U2G1_9EUKA|nr:MAG: hypothetical protein EZS28_040125 [Streblomastix strix]
MWSYGQGGLGNTQQFPALSPQGKEQPQMNLILGRKRIPQPLNYPRNPRSAIEVIVDSDSESDQPKELKKDVEAVELDHE